MKMWNDVYSIYNTYITHKTYNSYNTYITYNSYLSPPLKMKKATGVNLRLFLTRQPEGLDFIHNPHSQFNI